LHYNDTFLTSFGETPCKSSNPQILKSSNPQKNRVKTLARVSSYFVIGLVLSGQAALAAPYCFQYTDTISSSGTLPTGLAIGDSATITVKLDNGGTSLNSQTWNSSHLQSVTFDFKNGTVKTTFSSPWGGNGLNGSSGSFVTDGAGALTAVMSDWHDNNGLGTDYTTNSSNTPFTWYLNGANSEYYETSRRVNLTNVTNVTVASSWSNVTCPVVSAPVSAPIDLHFSTQPDTFATEIVKYSRIPIKLLTR
jgi:hypothetical protein